MKISNLDNKSNYNKIAFSANESGNTGTQKLYEDLVDTKKKIKDGVKSKISGAEMEKYAQKLGEIEKLAKGQLTAKDKSVPEIYTQLVKWFGKIKVEKTGNKNLDTASRLTKVILWGNVGKEAVGTTLYTIQALTNKDLPEDKRKYVGMYDLAVGVVSTAFSFIFGVGLEKSIKNGYKNILKPLGNSTNPVIKSKAAAAIVGLAAFSSFFLQTIIGKRIVAPAIAVPAAGKLRKGMEEKDAAKKQQLAKVAEQKPAEAKQVETVKKPVDVKA